MKFKLVARQGEKGFFVRSITKHAKKLKPSKNHLRMTKTFNQEIGIYGYTRKAQSKNLTF